MTTDRLDEIEARIEVLPSDTTIVFPNSGPFTDGDHAKARAIYHAPGDIRWLIAEVRRLREALEPFAAVGRLPFIDDGACLWERSSWIDSKRLDTHRITVAHVKHAAEVLKK